VGEAAVADCMLGDIAKEALDKIHPAAGGGYKMLFNSISSVLCLLLSIPSFNPVPDFLLFMRAVVVQDYMQSHVAGRLPVQLFKKPKPFNIGMFLLDPAKDLACKVVQGGK
jgi:hypothetical protein